MSEPIDPILLCTVLPLQKLKRGGGDGLSAEEVTNLSQDTLRRNYPHLIRRISERRSGMQLADALAIADGKAEPA